MKEISTIVEDVVCEYLFEPWSEQVKEILQIKLESAFREADLELHDVKFAFSESTHELNIEYAVGNRRFVTTASPSPATFDNINNA